jgi:hypothetical protein
MDSGPSILRFLRHFFMMRYGSVLIDFGGCLWQLCNNTPLFKIQSLQAAFMAFVPRGDRQYRSSSPADYLWVD